MTDSYQDGYKFGYDSTEQVFNNALAHRAGGMLARGDQTGAQNALFSGGQLDEGYKLQDRQTTQRKAKAEAAGKFADGIRKTYEHGKAQGMADQDAYAYAWKAGETYAPQLGIEPGIINGAREHYAQDPGGFIATLADKAERELQFFQTDTGILQGDKKTGKVGMAYPMTKAPRGQWVERKNADGSTARVWLTDPTDDAPAAPAPPQEAPQPAGTDWTAPVAAAAPDARVTSGYRTPAHNAEVGGKPLLVVYRVGQIGDSAALQGGLGLGQRVDVFARIPRLAAS